MSTILIPGISDNAITDALLRDSIALSLMGRASNSSGDPGDIQATAASDAVLRESGSTIGFGTIATGGIADAAISNALIRDSAALSVLGRASNSSGDVDDIAGTDGQVLRVSGTTLGFGEIATAGVANSQITFAKFQNVATDSLIGRDAAGAGVASEIALVGAVQFTGAGAIDIIAGGVTLAMQADLVQGRLIGRGGASGTGAPELLTIGDGLSMAGTDLSADTKVYRVGHTYAISGEIKVPSGDTDFIIPFFYSAVAGQTANIVKARHSINSGTSATVKLTRNAGDITGYTGITVNTTPSDTTQTQALSDNDEIALVVTAVSGTPTNMNFTIFIELTQ